MDSFNLQQASIQDTFLLRVIPDYIRKRLNTMYEENFQNKGVLVVIVPKNRSDTLVRYRIQTEYDNYYLTRLWQTEHPLFYTQISGRYVIVCDEWTGALTPVSWQSQQKAIQVFVRSGWLNFVADPLDAMFELHSSVYTWHLKKTE